MSGANDTIPDGWTLEDGRLTLRLATRDFAEAMAVLQEVGRIAEALDHHPDLHLERYRHVRLTTVSHDAGGLTARDHRLARQISRALAQRGLVGE